jgi:hypothetical protein
MHNCEIATAYRDAHNLAVQMREIRALQQELVVALDLLPPGQSSAELEHKLVEARSDWLQLSRAYTEAVGQYAAAVDRSRQERSSRLRQ